MKTRILTWILAAVLILGILPAHAAEIITVSDLTKSSVISATGLPASSVQTKSGSFSMKWAEGDIGRSAQLPLSVNDFSQYNYLEFYLYSAQKNNTKFTIGLMSDNPETVCKDYYYANITVNWSGWKLVSLALGGEESSFQEQNTPVGMNAISQMYLWPTFNGNVPVEGTELYFDKITLSVEAHSDSIDTGDSELGNYYMLVDAGDPFTYNNLGLTTTTEVTGNSDVTLVWTGDKMETGFNISNIPTDWTPYKTLVFELYGANPTPSTIRPAVISENPDTDGTDYYMSEFSTDFEGWQTISITLSTMTKSRTPLGWDQITDLQIWNSFGGVSADPSTVLYIDRIYLTDTEGPAFSNDEDYLIPARTEEDFEDAVGLIKQNHPNNGHPRLLFDAEELALMKELVQTDSFARNSLNTTIAEADAALNTELQPYGTPDGKRLERVTPNRMPSLALAYLFTGDVKYKDRLWADIENICAYPDWNPSHYLDVGDFSRALAYAYDWLYDDWTEQEKRIMRNGFVRLAFAPSMSHWRNKTGFAQQVNNWNEVINAGVGLGALAIADEPGYEELCNEVINRTVDSLPVGLAYFAPDGACAEGPGYWTYAMQTFLQYNKSMFLSMGTDFGLTDMEGISTTGYFPISVMGSTGQVFNFGDGGSGAVSDPCMFWLAERFDQPELTAYVLSRKTGGSAYDLAFYRGSDPSVSFSKDMMLDNIFRGNQEVASFRSSWNDNDALFVAFKGGSNAAGHNDLDMGDFVLDALGVRWFTELGSEYYEAPGMWEMGPDGGRWKYYRKNVEGQNTILISPSDKPGQDVYATAPITTYETAESAAYGIVDLSEAYKDYAQDVKRGVGLINNRSNVIIQDEIKTNGASEIYTFYHTTADISISDDGKTAILSENGQQLKCQLLSPANGSFSQLPAEPLPGSADPGYTQYSNDDKTKLTVHLTSATDPTITVLFTPMRTGMPETATPDVLPLSQWDNYLDESASVQSIMVDGIELMNFSPANTFYSVTTGITGEVSAVADENTNLEVTQAQGLDSAAFVVATSETTGLQTVYTVNFTETIPAEQALSLNAYEIVGVEASDVPEPQNIPENTYDDDYSTKWAAEGEQWIKWDLGESKPVNSIMMAFMSGDARIANFDISISEDGENWTTIFSGSSSGKTIGLEAYTFPQTMARYVRYDGHGNSVNLWTSLTEVRIPEILQEFTDIESHWAKEDIMEMYGYGLVNGVSDIEFMPDATITRAEFISMVTRVCGIAEETYAGQFNDVAEGDWYAASLAAAYNSNLIPEEMITDGNLLPNAYITREEMAAIIVAAYENRRGAVTGEFSFGSFTDVDQISEYAQDYVKKGLALRLIKGASATEFNPKANATRAEAVVMMKRLLTQMG